MDKVGKEPEVQQKIEKIISDLKRISGSDERLKVFIEDVNTELSKITDGEKFNYKSLVIYLPIFESILTRYGGLLNNAHANVRGLTEKNKNIEAKIKEIEEQRSQLLSALKKLRQVFNGIHQFGYFDSLYYHDVKSEEDDSRQDSKLELRVIVRDQRGLKTGLTIMDEDLGYKFQDARRGQIVKYVSFNNGVAEVKVVIDLLEEFDTEGKVANVLEVMEDDLVKVSDGMDSEMIVPLANPGPDEISSGDKVLIGQSGFITRKLPKTEQVQDLILQEIPDVRFEDVGGLDTQIEEFRNNFGLPYLYPEDYKLFEIPSTRGVLFVGPPGCGKSFMVKAAINELTKYLSQKTGREIKGFMILINGPADVLRKYVGESEGRPKMFFNLARQKAKEGHVVMIIMEEFDAWVKVRGSDNNDAGVRSGLVTQINAEMDGIWGLNGVIVVGLTNRPDLIDPAVMRRFNSKIEVPRPNIKGAKDIFIKNISSNIPIHSKYFDSANYEGEWYYPRDENGERRKINGVEEKYHLCRNRERVINHFADKIMRTCYDSSASENGFLRVSYYNGKEEIFTFADFMSGDLIVNYIIAHAKKSALFRYVGAKDEDKKREGLKLKDLYDALDKVFGSGAYVPPTQEALTEWFEVNGIKRPPVKDFQRISDQKRQDDRYANYNMA